MDQTNLNSVTQTLTSFPSRRDVLRGLTSAVFGLGSLWLASDAEAKNKNKSKRKKKGKKKQKESPPIRQVTQEPQSQPRPPLVFNQYGCIDVGQPCRGDSNNCCSGICEGAAPGGEDQPDTSRCVGHNSSICKTSSDLCTTGTAAVCDATKPNRVCTLTTGNAGFCADFTPHIEAGTDASFYCRDCSRDIDCQTEFGPGAACVVYTGICSPYCPNTGNRACMPAGV